MVEVVGGRGRAAGLVVDGDLLIDRFHVGAGAGRPAGIRWRVERPVGAAVDGHGVERPEQVHRQKSSVFELFVPRNGRAAKTVAPMKTDRRRVLRSAATVFERRLE